jgi:hypothetical protein
MAVYRCPLDLTNTAGLQRQRSNKLSTYVMNGAVCGYGDIAPFVLSPGPIFANAYIMWEPGDTSP